MENNKVARLALFKAIELAGSQSALAKKIGVRPQSVQQWVARGCVSRKSARKVSIETGVPLDELLI